MMKWYDQAVFITFIHWDFVDAPKKIQGLLNPILIS